MVSSTHWLASAAGMAMLERGGNAFDAAVAAGMVLQVAEPHLNGPGGDLPLLLYPNTEQRVRVLCGQGTAPAQATIAHYRSLGLDLVPGTGLLATVVPGAFDAWMRLLQDYGTLRFEEVMEPALHYAKNGVPVLPTVRDTIAQVQSLLATEWVTSAAASTFFGMLSANSISVEYMIARQYLALGCFVAAPICIVPGIKSRDLADMPLRICISSDKT